jgi:hypothetical protein
MRARRFLTVTGLLMALITAVHAQQGQRGRGPQAPPDIAGQWSGTWSYFNPAQATTQPKEICKKLDATVVRNGETWVATFEGDCGRPYKYKISMDGRFVGGVVMFKGTVDLGAQDGGVFDWVGRATATEFVGFYTSAMATGFFDMKKVK